MEQMMRGRLVVVSDIGGLGEVVDGTGLKFPCGDVQGLTACLRRVLGEPELVEELGPRGRVRALELFTQKRMVEEYAKALHECAAVRLA
jgi:glycosyltransferase involved in cell wall biosynthesis